MVNRLSKRVVIVSIIGLAIAAVGLLVDQDWIYFTGLMIATPLFIFYAIPMVFLILWVALVAWWCPWKPHVIYFKEEKSDQSRPA